MQAISIRVFPEVCREVGPAAAVLHGALFAIAAITPEEEKGPNNIFMATNELLMELTGHTKHTLQTALKYLKNTGWIETSFYGNPPRRHFRIFIPNSGKVGKTA